MNAELPPVVPSRAVDLADKRPCKKWLRAPLPLPTRTDLPFIEHWTTAEDAQQQQQQPSSLLSRYENHIDVVEYTEEEYAQWLQDDGDWSRAETDYLFSLCRQFDCRFIVIADRYSFTGEEAKPRTIEDLKERYYLVTKKILQNRNPLADPYEKAYLSQLVYDKKKEQFRKNYVQQLIDRPKEEILDEVEWMKKIRYLQRSLPYLEATRNRIIRTFEADTFGRPSLMQIISGEHLSDRTKKKKAKKPSSIEVSTPAVSTSKKKDRSAPSAGLELDIFSPAPASAIKKEKKIVGVALRSSLITVSKSQATQQKVIALLEEFGVSALPKMPTREVCDHFDELHQSILTLLDAKRHVERLEQELKQLQAQKAALETTASMMAGPSTQKKRSLTPAPKQEPSKRLRT